jgi:endonuclease/exonuclease/phosphatase family metal-dependent hydrolase
MTISLVTLNIFKSGTGTFKPEETTEGKIEGVLSKIAAQITALHADIVAIQEVDRNVRRSLGLWGDRTIGGYLGEGWIEHFSTAKHSKSHDPAQGPGLYGNAILTRRRIEGCWRPKLGKQHEDQENRSAIAIQFGVEGRRVCVINLHLGLKSEDQAYQLDRLMLFIATQVDRTANIILCGDFNISVPPREGILSYEELLCRLNSKERNFVDLGPDGVRTHRVGKIDYIFFSRGCITSEIPRITVQVINFREMGLSDHSAIKMGLTFTAEESTMGQAPGTTADRAATLGGTAEARPSS